MPDLAVVVLQRICNSAIIVHMDPYAMQQGYAPVYGDPPYVGMQYAEQPVPMQPFEQGFPDPMVHGYSYDQAEPPQSTVEEREDGIFCKQCDCLLADVDAEMHAAAQAAGDCKVHCCYCAKHDSVHGRLPKAFKNEQSARQHRKAAHAWCEKCKLFIRDVSAHNAVRHPPPVAPCPLCSKGFKAVQSMEHHRSLVHFKCANCKQWFKSRKDADGHDCHPRGNEPEPAAQQAAPPAQQGQGQGTAPAAQNTLQLTTQAIAGGAHTAIAVPPEPAAAPPPPPVAGALPAVGAIPAVGTGAAGAPTALQLSVGPSFGMQQAQVAGPGPGPGAPLSGLVPAGTLGPMQQPVPPINSTMAAGASQPAYACQQGMQQQKGGAQGAQGPGTAAPMNGTAAQLHSQVHDGSVEEGRRKRARTNAGECFCICCGSAFVTLQDLAAHLRETEDCRTVLPDLLTVMLE